MNGVYYRYITYGEQMEYPDNFGRISKYYALNTDGISNIEQGISNVEVHDALNTDGVKNLK